MKVLFDQGVPAPLRRLLSGCEICTAFEMNWSTLENGTLLAAAEADGFDVFLTTDKNLNYQQNLKARRIAVVILPTTSWPRLRPRSDEILQALKGAKPGDFIAADDAEKKSLEGTLEHQAPVEVVVGGKGRSHLSVGLAALIAKGQSAVNVIALPDPALFEECQQFAGRVAISLLSGGEKWVLIERGIFEKWYPVPTNLAVRPTISAQIIDYQGLIKSESEFRVMDSQRVRISSDHFFWVREPY